MKRILLVVLQLVTLAIMITFIALSCVLWVLFGQCTSVGC